MTQSAAWEWGEQPGLEYLLLDESPAGVVAKGWVVGELEGKAFSLRYRVECDRDWRFLQAKIDLASSASAPRELSIRRGRDGVWLVSEQPRPDLAGCGEIDIMTTPFTNTLPIRRLQWQLNRPQVLRMAYIRVPQLDVSAADQEYTRLEPSGGVDRFRYRSLDSGFTAELTVDRAGLVVDYPGLWRRIDPLG